MTEKTFEEKSKLIYDIEIQIQELKHLQDKLKKDIQEALFDNGIYNSYRDNYWEVHHKLGSVTNKFDETSFSKAEPEVYKELFEKYNKTSVGKDSWNWTNLHKKKV